jgi:hypothetical protein
MTGWKQRISHEMVEYAVNVAYLALVFATLTQYRRLVVAAHDIIYTNYWVAVIHALVLGKVIMIGSLFRLGRSLEQKPLIFPTLYKAAAFTFLDVALNLIEHTIKGLWQDRGLVAGLAEFSERWPYELLAGSLVIFVALLPFFAVKELGRILGKGKMWTLFFSERG